MTSRAGLSGATVAIDGDKATKTDVRSPEKVVAQGKWLADRESVYLPRVYELLESGYVMERLTPMSTTDVSLDKLIDALQASVWDRSQRVRVDVPQTMLYVARILDEHAPHLQAELLDRIAFIHPTTSCRTHGDPTAENVMLRNQHYVLIDPIPASTHVPDDLAVDVGKLLQSAYGWEELKGEERASFTVDDVRRHFAPKVFEVGKLWHLVHLVRTLPYASEEVKKRVIELIEELLGSGR